MLTPRVVGTVVPLWRKVTLFGIELRALWRVDLQAFVFRDGCGYYVETGRPCLSFLAVMAILLLPALKVISHFQRLPTRCSNACLGIGTIDPIRSCTCGRYGGGNGERGKGNSDQGDDLRREMHADDHSDQSLN